MKQTILPLFLCLALAAGAGAKDRREHAGFGVKEKGAERFVYVVKGADGSADVFVRDKNPERYRWGKLPSYDQFAQRLSGIRVLELPAANPNLGRLCSGQTWIEIRLNNKEWRYRSSPPNTTAVSPAQAQRYKELAQLMLDAGRVAQIPITAGRFDEVVLR